MLHFIPGFKDQLELIEPWSFFRGRRGHAKIAKILGCHTMGVEARITVPVGTKLQVTYLYLPEDPRSRVYALEILACPIARAIGCMIRVTPENIFEMTLKGAPQESSLLDYDPNEE